MIFHEKPPLTFYSGLTCASRPDNPSVVCCYLKGYTGNRSYYPLESLANAIGDLTAINDNELLIIERDNSDPGLAADDNELILIKLPKGLDL